MKDKREYDAYIQNVKLFPIKHKTNEFPKHKCSLC